MQRLAARDPTKKNKLQKNWTLAFARVTGGVVPAKARVTKRNVIPAKARVTKRNVIPAKAGIQSPLLQEIALRKV